MRHTIWLKWISCMKGKAVYLLGWWFSNFSLPTTAISNSSDSSLSLELYMGSQVTIADTCVWLVVFGLQLGNACVGDLHPFKYNCTNKWRIWFRDYSFILFRFHVFCIWFLQFFLLVNCYLCFHWNTFDSWSMWNFRVSLCHVLQIIQRPL